MSRTISLVRKELVKKEYLKTGGSGYKALKAGGLAESTARHSVGKKNTLLNMVKAEVAQELNDSELVAKAYNTLDECLHSEKKSDRIAAAQVLLRFKVGDTSKIDANIVSEEKKLELSRLAGLLSMKPQPVVINGEE